MMNKLYLIIALCITFASCSKKKIEQPKSMAQICAELYPCATTKDSIKIDTVIVNSPPQYKVVTQQVITKGDTVTIQKIDTIYPIPIERIITKTVLRTVLDSALLQTYKDNIYALERRILASEKNEAEQKLTIIKIKGNRTNWIISNVAGWLLVLAFLAFFYYVWRHNQIKKEEQNKNF